MFDRKNLFLGQGRCQTPYAEEKAERAPPDCDQFCCEADAEDGGAWVQHPSYQGHKVTRSRLFA
jgi:hypothetical protein